MITLGLKLPDGTHEAGCRAPRVGVSMRKGGLAGPARRPDPRQAVAAVEGTGREGTKVVRAGWARRGRGVLCLAALFVAAECGPGGGGSEHAAGRPDLHWSYQGKDGPQAWGSLATDYAHCADGSAQSPIAIEHTQDMPLPDLQFDYRTTSAEISDTGHTEQVTVPPGSSLVLEEVPYRLEQLHFHAPSEHSVSGRSFPVEFHFVHRSDGGAIAVVAVLAIEGVENPAWEPLLERLPTKKRVRVDPFDVAALLPGDATSTRYEGSLTTPPCSEGVHWIVLDIEVELSHRQIATLTNHYAGNNRPPQPLNGRLVAHDATRGD